MSLIDFRSNTKASRTAPRTQSQVAGSGVTTCRGGGGGGGGGGEFFKGNNCAITATAETFCMTAADPPLMFGAGLARTENVQSNSIASAVKMIPTNGLVDTIIPRAKSRRSLASNSIAVNTH